MSELPKGWVEASVGVIANVESGVGFPKKYQGLDTKEVPVFKVGDISKAVQSNLKVLTFSSNYVDHKTKLLMKAKLYPKGSTLFAKIGEALKLNRRGFLGVEGIADNNVMGVIPFKNFIEEKLLFYFLRTVDLSVYSRSSAIPSLRKGDVESLICPLPPLKEQQRIVEKLDEVLAQVDAIKGRLDSIPAIIKRFRQSVLASAVSGKLTEEWRGKGVFRWKAKSLGDVVEISPKKQKYADDLKVSFSPMQMMPILYGESLKFEEKNWRDVKKGFTSFIDGDVLMAKITPCFENEKSVVAEGLTNSVGTGSTEFMVLRPTTEIINSFLLCHIKTADFLKQGEVNMTGSVGHRRVPKEFVANWKIQLPPIDEQKEIVRLVDEYFALADTIEAQVNKARARVDNLTQSILAKAFRGELVPQDDNDEPADKLLERIAQAKAEAEALAKAAKKAEAAKKRAAKKASA